MIAAPGCTGSAINCTSVVTGWVPLASMRSTVTETVSPGCRSASALGMSAAVWIGVPSTSTNVSPSCRFSTPGTNWAQRPSATSAQSSCSICTGPGTTWASVKPARDRATYWAT